MTWIEYFHTGIFLIFGIYLIRKCGFQTDAFFLYFSAFKTTVLKYFIMKPCYRKVEEGT